MYADIITLVFTLFNDFICTFQKFPKQLQAYFFSPNTSKNTREIMYVKLKLLPKKNDILCNHQYGFAKISSTSDAILDFLNYYYYLLTL